LLFDLHKRTFGTKHETPHCRLGFVVFSAIQMSDVSEIQNINLTKDLLLLYEVIIPKLLNHSLYLHSLTFFQIKNIFQMKNTIILLKNLKPF